MSLQKHLLAVRLHSTAMRLASWVHGLPAKLVPPPFRLVQLGAAFWQSRALHAAARLDLARIIGEGTVSAEEIARAARIQPDATARLLRMLAAIGVFEEASHRHFRNNALSDLLRPGRHNLRAMILMHNSEQMSRPWYERLEEGLATGIAPFELAHGADLYLHMSANADFDTLFAEAMDSVETLSGDSFAVDFDWSRFDRIIDVGGSRGQKAATLLQHHPHLTALVVDRAPVIAAARRYRRAIKDDAVVSRLEFRAGDVMDSVPQAASAGDVYFLSGVLHGFDDERSSLALRNLAAAAAPAQARIVLLELVLDETRPALAEVLSDMQMFMGTAGRERTLGEWQALFARGGVTLEEIVSLRSFGKMLVLRPERFARSSISTQ